MVKSAAVEQSTVLCVQRIGECFAPVRHVVADHTLTRGQPAAPVQPSPFQRILRLRSV